MGEMLIMSRNSRRVTNADGKWFILGGLVFLCASMFLTVSQYKFEKNAVPITAIIEDIDVHRTRNSSGKVRKDYDVYVSYTFNGQKVKSELDTYKKSMDVGEKLNVYVKQDNPKEVRLSMKDNLLNYIGLGLFGGFMTLSGIGICTGKFEATRIQTANTRIPTIQTVARRNRNRGVTINTGTGNERVNSIASGVICIVLGVCMIQHFTGIYLHEKKFDSGAIPVIAQVMDIEKETKSERVGTGTTKRTKKVYHYNASVQYTHDGRIYNSKLDNVGPDMKVGDKVNVIANPNIGSYVKTVETEPYGFMVFSAVGLLSIYYGLTGIKKAVWGTRGNSNE